MSAAPSASIAVPPRAEKRSPTERRTPLDLWGPGRWPPQALAERAAAKAGTLRDRVVWLATAQHGVLALWQLSLLGAASGTARRWAAAGYLHRVHHGVYAVGHRALSPAGRQLAGVLACGPGAAVCGRSAVQLHGLAHDRRALVDVAIAAPGHRRHAGLAIHRLQRLQPTELTVRNRVVPVTTLPRTLLDVAAEVGPAELRELLARAQRRRKLDVEALSSLVQRSSGLRGVAILREAAAELLPGGGLPRLGLEGEMLGVCRAWQLPEPIVNGLIRLEHRTLQVDFHWPAERLVVETDGYEAHSDIASHEEDRRRDQDLAEIGWEVLRFTWRQVTGEPQRTARIIGQVLASRHRDRPPTRAES